MVFSGLPDDSISLSQCEKMSKPGIERSTRYEHDWVSCSHNAVGKILEPVGELMSSYFCHEAW